jgi:hypothetical protein
MNHDKNVQWAYVTVDSSLADKACWLHWAYLVVSAGSTDSALYDGHDTNGAKITDLKSAAVTGHEFKPAKPIFCRQGLYVDVGTSVSGIFVEYEMEDSHPHPLRPAE